MTTYFQSGLVYLIIPLALSLAGCSIETNPFTHNDSNHLKNNHNVTGFFTPSQIEPALIGKTQFGMINAYSIEQVESSLKTAKGSQYKVMIVILRLKNKTDLQLTYTHPNGSVATKILGPNAFYKVFEFASPADLATLLVPYFGIMERYKDHISAVFIADEPYLNGLSKTQMESIAQGFRKSLNARDMGAIQLGLIFSSAMFDSGFAKHIDRAAGRYVVAIDTYYLDNKTRTDDEFVNWKKIIVMHRLSTYDQAGNFYTGGGVPQGFDIIAFNFYLSTLLLDENHNLSLDYFAKNSIHPSCDKFKTMSVKDIRKNLPFFQDGPVIQGDAPRTEDKKLLDAVFECRINAVTQLLKKQSLPPSVQYLLISESSNNGVLEFDAKGTPEKYQPTTLIELRVLEEVKRATQFYQDNKNFYNYGLMFFTYGKEYDKTINLNIGGVSSMPSVTDHIFNFAAPNFNISTVGYK
jgi:hypothetical protein